MQIKVAWCPPYTTFLLLVLLCFLSPFLFVACGDAAIESGEPTPRALDNDGAGSPSGVSGGANGSDAGRASADAGSAASQPLAEQRDAVLRACELLCDTEVACGLDERNECLRDCSREEGVAVAGSRDTPADRACLDAMRDYFACLSGAECGALDEGDACESDEDREEEVCRGLSWWRD